MAGARSARTFFASLSLVALPLAAAWPALLRAVGPPPDPPGDCSGKPLGVVSLPLGTCKPDQIIQYNVSSVYRCSGSQLVMHYYNSSTCTGPEVWQKTTAIGSCVKPLGSRGVSTIYTCNETTALVASYSSRPAAPTRVSCLGAGQSAGSLGASCRVDAHSVDRVSFEISLPSGRPFLGVVARAGPDGEARAAISGLQPGEQYRIVARSHRTGGQEGDPDTWSDTSHAGALCTAGAASSTGRSLPPRRGHGDGSRRPKTAQKTRWLETYRLVGGFMTFSSKVLADFLDQHNAADLPGLMGMVSMYSAGPVQPSPLTRYCVEVLDVDLPNVITADVDGKPQTAPFADFASCNQGVCRCMHQVDRGLAHLPEAQIRKLCAGHRPADYINNTCECPPAMMAQSNRYVGRAPIPLPFTVADGLMQQPMRFPPNYPAPFRPGVMGSFLSFPAGGRCPLGVRPGEGNCTWQRSSTTYTVYLDDLVHKGFNVSSEATHVTFDNATGQPITQEVDYDATIANIRVTQKAFAQLRPPPCGEEEEQVNDQEEAMAGTPEVVVV